MTNRDWKRLDKAGPQHKYDYGQVFVIAGPYGRGGAARLAARSALRVGAGLVTVLCEESALKEHAGQQDAVMVKPVEALESLIQKSRPIACCVGPGLGQSREAMKNVETLLSLGVPSCVDADALNLIAVADGSVKTHPRCVLTPHMGEMRRLLPEETFDDLDGASLAAEAAAKFGCTVILKGATSFVATSFGEVLQIDSSENPTSGWLATAGSGDVLAGLVTGLLARGFETKEAASIAIELHLRCAEMAGPGLISEDLPEQLPKVFAEMLPLSTSV